MADCKIYIVRHTQTVGNIEKRLTGRQDYELTEEGKRYVDLLTQELIDVKFDEVYSSTSGRAKKTIQPLAEKLGKEIIEDSNLCEMYFGIYDGWKWEDVNRENPNIKRTQIEINRIQGIPEQEDMDAVAERMYECIENIAKNGKGKTILIASHGVAIEAFLRKIVGLPFAEQREKYCQLNTAINVVDYENGQFNIVRLADMEHINRAQDNSRD